MLQGVVPDKNGDREKYLLRALLNLLLYIGNDESDVVKEFKHLVFTNGTNPPTDYSRPKTMMGG